VTLRLQRVPLYSRSVSAPPVIVHLIGFPAAGKLTVAKALAGAAARRGDRYVVLDNHHTSNVIFAALDVDGVRRLPDTVWDRVGEVREALLHTIEQLSPTEWSFVFTNVLTEGNAEDRKIVERMVALADARGNRYVPIKLHCRTNELVARVDNTDRKDRLKWVDPAAVRTYVESRKLIRIDRHSLLDIDTTSLPPEAAALQILDHIDRLA
jgi:hypothetical protein